MKHIRLIAIGVILFFSCGSKKERLTDLVPAAPKLQRLQLDGMALTGLPVNTSTKPLIQAWFNTRLSAASLNAIRLEDRSGRELALDLQLTNGDSGVQIRPLQALDYLEKYTLRVRTELQSAAGAHLQGPVMESFATRLDSSRKFETLTPSALLDKVQQQTLRYFWDYGHPVSGLARERSNGDPEIVTTGGSGFGIMALLVAAARAFKTRAEVLQRLTTMVEFLKTKARHYHGAYPHWLHGSTGEVIPFSANDNGADLVETGFLVQGLLCARQYFNGSDEQEAQLRNDINAIVDRVEWDWFRQGDQQVLYWHWSPDKAWNINLRIQGWNESLITYVLAAASKNHSIPKTVYDQGWARSGAIKNGNRYYNYILPLGEALGGPLFFEHYSFLGLDPHGLKDGYAEYELQTRNHSLINYSYCVDNPKGYYGYSDSVWGLSAGDIKGGYAASAPTNDLGYITTAAAIGSLPFTPEQSLAALNFYYYVLGDRLFGEYGFVDAFSLDLVRTEGAWFADSYLAIDQGPIIVMIENYRSGLLWDLLMGCPEIQQGLEQLGFQMPG
ncbi:hypothetical protein GCM10027051_17350 [Niabella terrae]